MSLYWWYCLIRRIIMKLFLILIALSLVACKPQAPEQEVRSLLVETCIDITLVAIRSPATFSIHSYKEHPDGATVSLIFDAANAFGALVRTRARCKFNANVKLETYSIDNHEFDFIALAKLRLKQIVNK